MHKLQITHEQLLETIQEGIWVIDADSITTFINPKMTEIIGYEAEEMIGKHLFDIMDAEEIKYAEIKVERRRKGISETHKSRLIHKDGHHVYINIKAIPITDAKGNYKGAVAGVNDITDREHERKKSNAISALLIGLSETNDLAGALRLCLDTAIATTEFDSGGIYIRDEKSDILNLAVHRGLSKSFINDAASHDSDSPQMKLILSGQPIYSECSPLDVSIDKVRSSEGLRAIAIVPVIFSQKVIACFNVASHSTSVIAEADKATLESIAAHIGGFIARLLAEEALRESEEKFRLITENMVDVVWLLSADNSKMIYISPSYEQIWGRSCQSLYDNPQSFMDSVHAEDMEKVQAEFNRYLKSKLFDLEYRIARPDGELRWVHARSYPVRNNFGEIVNHAGTAVDITERKAAEEELLFLSRHDQLTRLFSRFHFEQLISEPLQADTLPLCVIMADLNGLKMVNDSHGTHLGDEMLKKAALLIRQACRDEDIIARWGGDEFAILIPKSTAKQADALIKKIAKSCKGQFIEDIPLSMTMGVACKTEATGDLFLTLREAENNLARHKLTEARSAKHAVLQALLKTLAAKSYETEAHTRRMQQVAQAIGEKVYLAEAELSRLNLLINLHDIGKINIAEAILTKESALSEEEWQSIKTHPEVGYRIARATDEFAHVAEDILAHHERWDGNGYPRGLKGEEIPLLSRITAIADAYEVMSNGRPYKVKLSKAEIRAELRNCAGKQFDPQLAELFLAILEVEEEMAGI